MSFPPQSRRSSYHSSAGSFHSLAIGSDGKLYTWGITTTASSVTARRSASWRPPKQLSSAFGVSPTTVSAGYSDSLAIGYDGNLYAWGYNANGELGDGTTDNRSSPEVITLASGVTPTAIAANGWQHTLAIGSSGSPPVAAPARDVARDCSPCRGCCGIVGRRLAEPRLTSSADSLSFGPLEPQM